MDLAWQINIIDELIKENPDARIIDFINLLEELKQIEDAADKHNQPDN